MQKSKEINIHVIYWRHICWSTCFTWGQESGPVDLHGPSPRRLRLVMQKT